jgi:hypothetical protein
MIVISYTPKEENMTTTTTETFTKDQILWMSRVDLDDLLILRRSGCTDCSDCSRCSDCSCCTDCSCCSCCSRCVRCIRCVRCCDCTDCSRCYDCTDCSRCFDCFGCSGQTDKRHMVLNVQMTMAEYKRFLANYRNGEGRVLPTI